MSGAEGQLHFRARDDGHWQAVRSLARRIAEAGGRAHLVGGCVRDALLGRTLEDFDIEVFGLEAERLKTVMRERFEIDLVGESFGVIKVRHLPVDVSLPRRESKRGRGHRGFEIFSDPHLDPSEAAARRDFTINAIAFDLARGRLIDPWGGVKDLEERLLRHTSAHFVEDPLRVLRGMQLAARFELEPVDETIALARTMGPEGLARERVFGEWKKLVLRGRRISRGVAFLRATGWVGHFPELEALIGCAQDPEWHPEGDVWQHTLYVMDAFADERVGDDWEDLVVGMACLCHDLGKPATTRFEDGRWRSKGHEEAGEEPTRSFLGRLSDQERLVSAVLPLVLHHLKPQQLFDAQAGDAAVRRLARKVGRIDRLLRVVRADQAGRPPLDLGGFPVGVWLEERATRLAVAASAPKPIVLGRHLVARGLEPGPAFGPILEACMEAQLDGVYGDLEGGLRFLDQKLSSRGRSTEEPQPTIGAEPESRGLSPE